MANSVGPDQTAPIGAVCSGSTMFASIRNSSLMLGNYLQQTTSADDIFRCIFFLGALRVNSNWSVFTETLLENLSFDTRERFTFIPATNKTEKTYHQMLSYDRSLLSETNIT